MLGISESKQIGTKAYRNGRSCLRSVPSGCVCSDMRNKTESAGNRRCLLVSAGLRMPGHARCHDTGMWRLPGAYFRRAAHVWAYMRSATSWSRGGLSCVPGSQRRHGASSPCPTTPTHGRSVDWTCGRIRRIRKSLRSRGIAEILRFGGVRRGAAGRAGACDGGSTGLCLAGGCIPAGVVSGVWIC